jgi:ubiquinone/menaquinone biosynthesis C-methylase UbiE
MSVIPQMLGSSTATSDFAIANRLSMVVEIVDLKNKIVLDVGCNDAAYSVELAKHADRVVGIDIEYERLEKADPLIKNLMTHIGLLIMSAEEIGFQESTFDIVFINEALEHIPNQENALKEIYRVLNGQGHFVLFAPNRLFPFETHGMRIGKRQFGRFIPIIHWLPRSIGQHLMNARSYTSKELEQLLIRHGFTINHQSFLFPPLDGLKGRLARFKLESLIDAYRRMIPIIGKIPVVGSMGLSIFIVATKPETKS